MLHSNFPFFNTSQKKIKSKKTSSACACSIFLWLANRGRDEDQRYVSIKKMRKEIWNGIISEICAMCIHYAEWTFECAIFKARAHGLAAFLSPPTPCSRQLVRLAVRRSFALSLVPLLPPPLLSPLSLSSHPLFLCVWRLRNNTRQVTVVTLRGIGGCLLLCKSAGAWGSSLSVSTQPSNDRLAVEKPASKEREKKNTLAQTWSILLCAPRLCVYFAVFAEFRWCRWAVKVLLERSGSISF